MNFGSFSKVLVYLTGISLVSSAALAGAPEPSAVIARVSHAATPPAIDGLLQDPVWKEAVPYGQFARFGDGKAVEDTTFQLAYDDAWLYLAVDCRNADMKAIQPIVKGHDRGACKDDSVEFLLDPVGDGKLYYHYMLSFANARDERSVADGRIKEEWDVPWRSATHLREDGWSAEIAIPLYVAASGADLSKLRINVARNRRVPVIDSQHVVVEENTEASSWAPAAKSFHEPEKFRPVAGFAPEMKVRVPPLVGIRDARVRPYYANEGRTFYAVEIDLGNYNNQRSDLSLTVLDQPFSRPAREITQAVEVANAASQSVRVAIPVDAPSGRSVTVLLKDPLRGEVLDTFAIEDISPINVMTAFLDRNYYTSEDVACVVCRVGLPPETLKGLRLESRAADGTVLGALPVLRADSKISIPLKGLPLGVSPIDVTLCSREGAPLFRMGLQLVRRTPMPGLEWKIDQERRVVLNNGKPFFPFGVIMSQVKASDLDAFKILADHNLNTFLVWNRSTPEGLAEYQKNAAAYGLFTVAGPDECVQDIQWDCYSRYSGKLLEQVKRVTENQNFASLKNVLTLPIPVAARTAIFGEFYNKNIDRCIRGVELAKGFNNLTSYFILDEPMESRYFDQCKFGQDYYARIQRADGYHPVIVNFSSYIPAGDQYVSWCDILMTDPYWIPPATDAPRTTVNHVSKTTWMTDQRAVARRQAVWITLAGPRWSRCFKRALNQREIRGQTYLAIIHGATGIFYFSYAAVRPADWATFKSLGAEVKALSPFVLGPEVEQTISYRRALLNQQGEVPQFVDCPFDPLKEQYPDVQALVLSDPNGNYMLLAANSRHYPVACRVAIPSLQKAAAEFGVPMPTVRDGAFTDTLEPYATRAWKIELGQKGVSVAVTLEQTVLKADLPNPETVLPNACRKDRKNVLPNPSFEEATAEGCPDYCLVSPGATIQEGEALFGKRCVQLEKTGGSGYEVVMMHCDPQDTKPQTYTLSVYLKGSRDGLQAWLRGPQMNPEKPYGENVDIPLTTTWKRYSITGIIPAKVSEALYEVRLRESGTMWVDGMQLERGDTATEFEP